MKKGFTLVEELVILALLGIIVMAFFSMTPKTQASEKGCGGWFEPSCNTANTQKREAIMTEDNQRRLLNAVPVPQMETSEERKNLVRRLETFNSENKVSYIYLVSFGKIMAFYTLKGKVSSVNSMLTTTEQVIDKSGRQCSYGSGDCFVVSSPDIDGSYGSNGDAIFFFTTDGTYVEWRGDYLLADQPLKLTQPAELVREIR